MASSQSLADRIFESLKEEIITCRFRPGELLNEMELARRFKTSRTPVREALNRLNQFGLVVVLRNRGTTVSPITIKDILNILQLRHILETACAEHAARALSTKELDRLANLIKIEREDPQKVGIGTLLRMNREFHVTIARSTRNDLIANLIDSLLQSSMRHDYFLMETLSGWTGHADVVRALKTRSPERARDAMTQHIQLSRKRMSEVLSGELFPTLQA